MILSNNSNSFATALSLRATFVAFAIRLSRISISEKISSKLIVSISRSGATLAGIEWIPVIPLSFEPFSFNSVTELLERHDITTYEVQLWDDFVALLKQLPKHVSGINVRAYIDNYNQFSINIPNASLE